MAEPVDIVKKTFVKRGDSSGALDYGKLPPQARELEEAVLGAVMIESECINEVAPLLTVDTFYVDAHARIWRAIEHLYNNQNPIDLLTVTEQLKKHGDLEAAGGPFYISQLTNKVGSSGNAEYHARVLMEKYVARRCITISTETIKGAYEDTTDIFELLDKNDQSYMELNMSITKSGGKSGSVGSAVMDELKLLDGRMGHEDGLIGIDTGLHELNETTGGWQNPDLIILAARPSMGKTALALSLARAAAEANSPVAIFSLEMSVAQLTQRMMAAEAQIELEKIRKGRMNQDDYMRLTRNLDRLKDAPIHIDDTPAISAIELKRKARLLKKQQNIKMIIVDYLQLMSGAGDGTEGNRENVISGISRALKSIAKELQIPVIALSQLSRAVETRGGDKKPILSDLRESGAIEQDADIVMFLYRGEYYGFDTDADGNNNKGIAEIIVAKHRNGPLKTIRTRFVGKYSRFENLSDYNPEEHGSTGPFLEEIKEESKPSRSSKGGFRKLTAEEIEGMKDQPGSQYYDPNRKDNPLSDDYQSPPADNDVPF